MFLGDIVNPYTPNLGYVRSYVTNAIYYFSMSFLEKLYMQGREGHEGIDKKDKLASP
jgi:hypothetical protein